MSEENHLPLDFEEVVDPKKTAAEKKVRKRLAFFLELIPLSILLVAFVLKYFDTPIWWWFFSVGAVMACLNYLFLSWFFFKPKDYHTIELGITLAFAACFGLGVLSILLRTYSWYGGIRLYSIALGGTCFLFLISGIMLLMNIREDKRSRFYRVSLARLMILLAILLRMMG